MSPAGRTFALAVALAAAGCAIRPAGVPRADAPGAGVLRVAGKLVADAVWRGEVEIGDDLQVPRGRTLRILAGTRVRVRPADTTKTEPEYLDNATELLVRGRLEVEGTPGRPVIFEPLGEGGGTQEERAGWGGIIFDRGTGEIRHARILGAETGVTLLAASPALTDVSVEALRCGVSIHRGSAPRLARVRAVAVETGVASWPGSAPELLSVEAEGAEHEGLLVAPGAAPHVRGGTFRGGVAGVLWGAEAAPPAGLAGGAVRAVGLAPPRPAGLGPLPFPAVTPEPGGAPARVYRGESFIGEDTTWEGEILIDGTVMVSPLARLTVAPGAVVRFVFRDSDGDGVGESEIFIQGVLAAEGTAERPIVFTAGDGEGPGRWGAINLMGSDERESSLAYCLVEHSFRGLHSHFSRFRVARSVFRRNYRALQFQESRASVRDCAVSAGVSGLRLRDSTVALEGLTVSGNTLGVQILRSSFSLTRSLVADNALAGVHVRESEGDVSGCVISGNSPGLRVSDSHLRIEGNLLRGNSGGGLLLRRTEARVEANRIADSVGNAVSTDSPQAVFRGNAVAGWLRFAVENNAAAAVDAAGNWWGAPAPSPEWFFDRGDDPRLGPVLLDPALRSPPRSAP